DLLNITKVSSLFARESAGSVTINVDESAQAVSIRSVASQLGENTATAAGKVTGDGTINLNSPIFVDGLQLLYGAQIQFSFNGQGERWVLRDPGDPAYTHIVMPLKS